MKQFILLMICLASVSLFSCSEIDNYKEPDSRIEGKLIDATTGELIPSQGLNGARVQLYEGTSVTPTTVWTRPDGTYKSERVFSGAYRIIPLGPFMPTDTVRTKIPTVGNLDFTVEPYLRIKLDESTVLNTSDSTATVKFTISRSTKWNGAMSQYAVVYSISDNFDQNGHVQRIVKNVTDAVLDVQQTEVIKGVNPGKPVYVRVAALVATTPNPSYWNYSSIKKLN